VERRKENKTGRLFYDLRKSIFREMTSTSGEEK
jgi:hypothetical protein